MTSQEMVEALQPRLLLFGTTKRLIMDQGTNFTAKLVKSMLKKHGIEAHYIITAGSRANGQAERYVSTVLNMLTCEVLQGKGWSSVLAKMQLVLNTTVQKSTGFRPLELLTGMRTQVAEVTLLGENLPESDEPIDVVKLRETVEERLRFNALRQSARFDRMRRNNSNYEVGDIVYMQEQRTRLGKLEPRYKGPYKISKVLVRDRYQLQHSKTKRFVTAPKDRLRRWNGDATEDYAPNTSHADGTVL